MVAGWPESTYTDQDTLALEVDVGDRELVGERHCDWIECVRQFGVRDSSRQRRTVIYNSA